MTLNYGVRFDYFRSSFPDQELTPATALMALSATAAGSPRNTLQTCATQSALCAADNLNWKDITPRFGMAYDLRGDGKTAIKVSANKYVAGVTANGMGATANPVSRLVNSGARTWTDGSNGNPKDYIPQCDPLNGAANGECGAYTGSSVGFGTLTQSAVTDNSLKNGWNKRGYNWEFSAGVQQQVAPRVSVEVSYFRRLFGNFTVVDNLNLAPSNFDQFSVIAPVDSRLGDRSGQTITGFYDVNNASKCLTTNNSTRAGEGSAGQPEPDSALERRGLQRQRAAQERRPAAGRHQHGPQLDEQLRGRRPRAGSARQHGAGGLRGDRAVPDAGEGDRGLHGAQDRGADRRHVPEHSGELPAVGVHADERQHRVQQHPGP